MSPVIRFSFHLIQGTFISLYPESSRSKNRAKTNGYIQRPEITIHLTQITMKQKSNPHNHSCTIFVANIFIPLQLMEKMREPPEINPTKVVKV